MNHDRLNVINFFTNIRYHQGFGFSLTLTSLDTFMQCVPQMRNQRYNVT